MKRHRRAMWVALALIGLLLLATGSASARATRTEYTGIETAGPLIEPGKWTYPNGHVHVRGLVQELYDVTDDARVTGTLILVANSNLDANMVAGNLWGTWSREVVCDGGGVWEGTWTGQQYADGTGIVHGVGHGVSGCAKGLELRQTVEYPSGTITGIILDPHGE